MSKVTGIGGRGEVEELGSPPLIQTPVDWAALGTAVHAFLAVDGPELERDERVGLAAGALERWSVQSAIHAGALAGASDAFRAWCERRWPSAKWHREWPVRLRQDDRTELVGYADMVVMTGESVALIDHKCLSGMREEALEAAAGYAGQLWAYAEAIAAATGKRAEGCFVHLVAQGIVVSVSKPAE
jgi:ATP-dependent exoDNAse (exonuclease V) beta subunit